MRDMGSAGRCPWPGPDATLQPPAASTDCPCGCVLLNSTAVTVDCCYGASPVSARMALHGVPCIHADWWILVAEACCVEGHVYLHVLIHAWL